MSSMFDLDYMGSWTNLDFLDLGAHDLSDLPWCPDQSHENIHGTFVEGLQAEVLDESTTLLFSSEDTPESSSNEFAHGPSFHTPNHHHAFGVHTQNLPAISSEPVDDLIAEVRSIHARVYDVDTGHFKCAAGCKVKADKKSNHGRHQDSVLRKQGVNVPRYSCTGCPATYSRRDHLQNHARTHQLPFRCSACGNTFKTKANLLKHMQYCTGSA